ncbi:penicillin-binding protein, partial [Rhizobium ruizarguesonis]
LPAARARANEVLPNLFPSGMMTEGQVIAARRHPAPVVDRNKVDSPNFFLDWAFYELQWLSPRFHQHSLLVRTPIAMWLQ